MARKMKLLITGGAGFIGSNFILKAVKEHHHSVVNIDLLTYASNKKNLEEIDSSENYRLIEGSIGNKPLIDDLLKEFEPDAIINFAAESHVDRSIKNSSNFITTNILGTHELLTSARQYWDSLNQQKQTQFRFLQISTDEVYGSLKPDDPPFTENSLLRPNSPYAASKASADHLCRAFFKTYELPIITTNCSNNYGPFQYPEKLIPLVINNCLSGLPIPVYGDGLQIRDWLHVDDHCDALLGLLALGRVGETYNIGGGFEIPNIKVVSAICDHLDHQYPLANGTYSDQIQFVKDRPGHDERYAIDFSKIQAEIGWSPKIVFTEGIIHTINWFVRNRGVERSAEYNSWIKSQYD